MSTAARRQADDDHGPPPGSRHRLSAVAFDPNSIKPGNIDVEQERQVAVYDILHENHFEVVGRDDGPYALTLGVADDRLIFTVAAASGGEPVPVAVPLLPLRRVIKDYFLVCETYFQAIRSAPPSRIRQIEEGRRALHDEGARVLAERLAGRITVDTSTARRLFVLVCALHWRG